jgi:hypothetical protein
MTALIVYGEVRHIGGRQYIVAMYHITSGFCVFWLQPSILLGQLA